MFFQRGKKPSRDRTDSNPGLCKVPPIKITPGGSRYQANELESQGEGSREKETHDGTKVSGKHSRRSSAALLQLAGSSLPLVFRVFCGALFDAGTPPSASYLSAGRRGRSRCAAAGLGASGFAGDVCGTGMMSVFSFIHDVEHQQSRTPRL